MTAQIDHALASNDATQRLLKAERRFRIYSVVLLLATVLAIAGVVAYYEDNDNDRNATLADLAEAQKNNREAVEQAGRNHEEIEGLRRDIEERDRLIIDLLTANTESERRQAVEQFNQRAMAEEREPIEGSTSTTAPPQQRSTPTTRPSSGGGSGGTTSTTQPDDPDDPPALTIPPLTVPTVPKVTP